MTQIFDGPHAPSRTEKALPRPRPDQRSLSAQVQPTAEEMQRARYHRQVVTTYWYMLGMFAIGLFGAVVISIGMAARR